MNTRAIPLLVTLLALVSRGSGQQSSPLVLTQTIPLPEISGGFNHHSADGKHHRVFLCASTNKTVEVLDLDSGKILKSLAGDKPAATCFAPDLNVLCVARGWNVQLFDAVSFEELAVVAMPSSIDELRYDQRVGQLLAGCMTGPTEGIATVGVAQRKLLGEIKTAPPQGFCIEDDGNRVFVCSPKANQISIVERKKSSAANAWKLTNPTGGNAVAYDVATHRLFVGCRKPAKLLVLDTVTGRAVATADIGKDTDDLSFDPVKKRIYVACGEGVISVIQQDDSDHYRNVATIPTAPGARNCVFVPETGQFCVTVPQGHNQEAAVLVYQTFP